MPFCPRCGTKADLDANFCSTCGFRLEAESTNRTALTSTQAPSEAEKVVGLIPHLLQRDPGHIGSRHYTLIITDRRIIVAQFTVQMIREAQEEAKRRAKEQGKGLISRMFAGVFMTSEYANKYWTMTPEQIMNETQGNFALDIPSVNAVVVERHVTKSIDDSKFTSYELRIESTQGAFSYTFDGDPEDVKTLRQFLGYRVRGEGAPRVIRLGPRPQRPS